MLVAGAMTTQLVSVEPDATVREAIAKMTDARVGAVAVCERSRLVGIFTERDVLRLAADDAEFRDRRVGDVMTPNPIVAPPDLRIVDAATIMGERKVRHLPVVEGENLLGMIGIRDVLRALVERVWAEHDAAARETAGQLLRS